MSYDEAREAAARAIHDRYEQITHWVKTLGKEPRPMETSGIKEVHRLDANAAIDAFLAALKADGYKLVRREATEEMDNATQDFDVYWAYTQDGRPGMPKDVWSAMWDAAPAMLAQEVKP